jgi:hypothetical protein
METVGENPRDIGLLVGNSAEARDWIATRSLDATPGRPTARMG